MGFAARKAVKVVEHVEKVVAIELLAACQALEFFQPMKTTACLESIRSMVRAVVPSWDKDRIMYPDIEAVAELIRSGAVWEAVSRGHIADYPGTECWNRSLRCGCKRSSDYIKLILNIYFIMLWGASIKRKRNNKRGKGAISWPQSRGGSQTP